MIKEPTLFILGAGASKPYGYPLASELKDIIIEKTDIYFREYFPDLYLSAYSDGKRLRERVKEFQYAFANCPSPMIDYFLYQNTHFQDIGKIAIFMAIAEKEKWAASTRAGISDENGENDDWIRYLLFKMIKDITPAEKENLVDKFNENKIRFITFNYDRSLEYIMHIALQTQFGISNEKVHELLKNIKIYHVFGHLPLLQAQLNPSQIVISSPSEYGNISQGNISRDEILKTIKTLHEREKINTQDIKAAIKWAQRIFFLGFGYAKENLKILNIKHNPEKPKHIQICGTSYKIHPKKIIGAKSFLVRGEYSEKSLNGIDSPFVEFFAQKSKEFLENQILE